MLGLDGRRKGERVCMGNRLLGMENMLKGVCSALAFRRFRRLFGCGPVSLVYQDHKKIVQCIMGDELLGFTASIFPFALDALYKKLFWLGAGEKVQAVTSYLKGSR